MITMIYMEMSRKFPFCVPVPTGIVGIFIGKPLQKPWRWIAAILPAYLPQPPGVGAPQCLRQCNGGCIHRFSYPL